MNGIELRPPSQYTDQLLSRVPRNATVGKRIDHLQEAWDDVLEPDSEFASILLTRLGIGRSSGLIELEQHAGGNTSLFVCAEEPDVYNREDFVPDINSPFINANFLYAFYNGSILTDAQFERLERKLGPNSAMELDELGPTVDKRTVYGEIEPAGCVDPHVAISGLADAANLSQLREQSEIVRGTVAAIRDVETKIVQSLNSRARTKRSGNSNIAPAAKALAGIIEQLPKDLPDVFAATGK